MYNGSSASAGKGLSAMRALIQRVHSARVEVGGTLVAAIDRGLLVFLGIHRQDGPQDVRWMANKVGHLRVFPEAEARFAQSVIQAQGSVLVVSQFTLYGQAARGTRPDFGEAAPASQAEPLYQAFVDMLQAFGAPVKTGIFGADMDVSLVNWGPVTIWVESPQNAMSGKAGKNP